MGVMKSRVESTMRGGSTDKGSGDESARVDRTESIHDNNILQLNPEKEGEEWVNHSLKTTYRGKRVNRYSKKPDKGVDK